MFDSTADRGVDLGYICRDIRMQSPRGGLVDGISLGGTQKVCTYLISTSEDLLKYEQWKNVSRMCVCGYSVLGVRLGPSLPFHPYPSIPILPSLSCHPCSSPAWF